MTYNVIHINTNSIKYQIDNEDPDIQKEIDRHRSDNVKIIVRKNRINN
jgi:hypothetical protein